MNTTITVAHLARVEGHGGITVELDGDAVSSVRLNVLEGARLLETLVHGRSFEQVSQILSRICAICSTSHALTSLQATENAFGIEVSPQTETLRELMHCGEMIESHALHLFLLAAPDYLNYPSAAAMAADHPEAVKLGLRLKKLGNSIQETVGGRAIHPVNAVPGGFSKLPAAGQLIALRTSLLQGVVDCETALDVLASLPAEDFCHSDIAFAALRDGAIVIRHDGTEERFPPADYRSLTNERPAPYSNARHSYWRGRPFLVGALPRLAINREKLPGMAALAANRLGLALPSGNPMDNNKAQGAELVFSVGRALDIVQRVLDEGLRPEPRVPVRPRAGTGTAVTEAPRGLLVHSYTYDSGGRLASADVVTPTAMNAAAIELLLRQAVEQSAEREPSALTRKLEMVARACDPCLSCSVHLVQKRHAT